MNTPLLALLINFPNIKVIEKKVTVIGSSEFYNVAQVEEGLVLFGSIIVDWGGKSKKYINNLLYLI
jgi:hypothetical protein